MTLILRPGIDGESFLFLTYFLDRFGDKVTQALVKNQENSLTSVDGHTEDPADRG